MRLSRPGGSEKDRTNGRLLTHQEDNKREIEQQKQSKKQKLVPDTPDGAESRSGVPR